MEQITKQDLLQKLKVNFGYDSFRLEQQTIIENILAKKDTLVIMPTGGGKSICFQLPALFFKGVTLVISPLIALMKDQVDSLKANGIPATYYNSSQSAQEQQQVFDAIAKKTIKLLYVAPESLPLLQNILNQNYISCIAIDEAHCISAWGHDFRPSYKQLSFLKKSLPEVPIVALTATADKATQEDIMEQLAIPNATRFVSSFNRENISLEVRPANERVQQIIKFIQDKPNDSGIVYCLSRKATEQLASKLQQNGIDAKSYHAGLSFEERAKNQEDFIGKKLFLRHQSTVDDYFAILSDVDDDFPNCLVSIRSFLCHWYGYIQLTLALRELHGRDEENQQQKDHVNHRSQGKGCRLGFCDLKFHSGCVVKKI